MILTFRSDLLLPPHEPVDVVEQLCDNELGAGIDLRLQIFDFLVFAYFAFRVSIRIR